LILILQILKTKNLHEQLSWLPYL